MINKLCCNNKNSFLEKVETYVTKVLNEVTNNRSCVNNRFISEYREHIKSR